MSSYANRKMWEAYETGRPLDVIRALERTGVPKPPRFRRKEWENKARPIEFRRLFARRHRPGTEVVWRFQ